MGQLDKLKIHKDYYWYCYYNNLNTMKFMKYNNFLSKSQLAHNN